MAFTGAATKYAMAEDMPRRSVSRSIQFRADLTPASCAKVPGIASRSFHPRASLGVPATRVSFARHRDGNATSWLQRSRPRR